MRGLVAISIGVALGVWTAGAQAHDGQHPVQDGAAPRSVLVAQAQAQADAPAEEQAMKNAPGITGQAPYRFKLPRCSCSWTLM